MIRKIRKRARAKTQMQELQGGTPERCSLKCYSKSMCTLFHSPFRDYNEDASLNVKFMAILAQESGLKTL